MFFSQGCWLGFLVCLKNFVFWLFFFLISLIVLKQKGKCKTWLQKRPSDFSSYTFPCELCQKIEFFNFLC